MFGGHGARYVGLAPRRMGSEPAVRCGACYSVPTQTSRPQALHNTIHALDRDASLSEAQAAFPVVPAWLCPKPVTAVAAPTSCGAGVTRRGGSKAPRRYPSSVGGRLRGALTIL